jgi:hypothetical protein
MAKKAETISMVDTFSEFKDLKNIELTTMISVLEESFRNVLAKMFGTDENFDVIVNPTKGDFEIWRNREIVEDGEVTNPNMQISLSEAKAIDPDFEVGEDGVEAWSQKDVTEWGGDTIVNLALEGRPKILPNMKRLTINLNFFTGKLPKWMLYHPHLLDWFPESLIYMQQVNAYDSEGKSSKFENEPTDYEYYFKFFPGYREKYEIKEEIED